jgi:protein-S-isoprenylcysteine O-methyltransferase Ste14
VIAHPWFSRLLVGLQFGLLGALFLLAGFFAKGKAALLIQLMAVVLGLWAVLTMRLGHFNIRPEPQTDAHLVTQGPYRWIRHPMYASIVYFTLPLVLPHLVGVMHLYHDLMIVVVWLGLLLTLWVKLRYEEGLLQAKFPVYVDYMRRSKRIIPGFF